MKTFKHYLIEKPLTPSQRIARSRQMKRIMPKIKKKREIAMRKKASPDQLKMRAQKKATDVIRKKFVPDGQDYKSMSFAQKIQLDKKVEKKKAAIKKIAKKLMPKIKRAEADRIEKLKANK
jgi:hypothetical protein